MTISIGGRLWYYCWPH